MPAFDELQGAVAAVTDRIGTATVAIGRDRRGTGVVIADGRVLTNAHNLRDRTTQITFADGRTAQAEVLGADPDDDEVSVGVGAEHLGLRGAPVGEGDLCGAIAKIVGVGEHPSFGDYHPGAPAIAPDGDGRRPDPIGHRRHGRLQFVQRWHPRLPSLVTCK